MNELCLCSSKYYSMRLHDSMRSVSWMGDVISLKSEESKAGHHIIWIWQSLGVGCHPPSPSGGDKAKSEHTQHKLLSCLQQPSQGLTGPDTVNLREAFAMATGGRKGKCILPPTLSGSRRYPTRYLSCQTDLSAERPCLCPASRRTLKWRVQNSSSKPRRRTRSPEMSAADFGNAAGQR